MIDGVFIQLPLINCEYLLRKGDLISLGEICSHDIVDLVEHTWHNGSTIQLQK